MFLNRLAFMAGALLVSSVCLADASDWYVSGGGLYIDSDDSRSPEDDLGPYLGIGYWVSEKFGLEAQYNDYSFDLVDDLGKVDIDGLTFTGRYYFLSTYETSPYLGLAFGVLDSDGPDGDDTASSVDVLGGVNWFLSKRWGLNTELRYRFHNDDATLLQSNGYEDWLLMVGLSYSFGDRVKPAPVPEPAPVAPAPPPEPPRDSDGDGVLDPQDECPGTPPGRPVDEVGCEKEIILELKGVHFAFDKAELRPEAIAVLNDGLLELQKYGEVRISIEGHTDSKGSESYNQELSERRARAVYDWFIGKGISADRMSWRGYGESRPIASNDTEAGRADNRRVELRIVD